MIYCSAALQASAQVVAAILFAVYLQDVPGAVVPSAGAPARAGAGAGGGWAGRASRSGTMCPHCATHAVGSPCTINAILRSSRLHLAPRRPPAPPPAALGILAMIILYELAFMAGQNTTVTAIMGE